MNAELDKLCINTIRTLSIDIIQQANSGHPGLPLGAAAMGYVVWDRFLRHNPQDPNWINRDRFVLSAGHGCALLYSLLHLTGYDLTLDDLKQFRQWGSRTPGHPESHVTPGVEATTGPLGQGVANIVGMAVARERLAAMFNTPARNLIDFRVFGICSDGDLMEGVASEASSLAGHLGLGCITLLYDDNRISIDGGTDITFTEDVGKRFEAYGWHVLDADGLDADSVHAAVDAGVKETARPTLIRCRTKIGYGSPHKVDTPGAHGSPLGVEEVVLTKENLGMNPRKSFDIAREVFKHMRLARKRGEALQNEWLDQLDAAVEDAPDFADRWENFWQRKLPGDWQKSIPRWSAASKPVATRKASEAILNALAPKLPWLVGGSADLAVSNLTYMRDAGDFQKENRAGQNLRFGIREHGMGAILNGIALTAPFSAYGSTFLTFFDYMKPAVRIAALSGLPVIYIYSHDSIGLGEDGPTHQPVEHLWSLRAIPNLWLFRPADANEAAVCWKLIVERRDGPCALVTTRQGVPVLKETCDREPAVERGAYIILDCEPALPDVILMATGSEVSLALDAAQKLAQEGLAVRVVSMPCLELFDAQPESYRETVLPRSVRNRIAIEAGATLGWWKYAGSDGDVVGLDRFGASAPASVCYAKFGFTAGHVIERSKALLQRNSSMESAE